MRRTNRSFAVGILFLAACVGFLFPATTAIAQTLQTAVSAWLDDDDATAVPLLAELARAGNEDAMLLLGQIARRPGELSPFLQALDRQERTRLLEAAGGRFGRSWLKRVKDNEPLADALLSVDVRDRRIAGARTLLELGENGQAVRVLKRVTGQFDDYREIDRIMSDAVLPRQVGWVAWIAADFAGRPRSAEAQAALETALQAAKSGERGDADMQGLLYLRHLAPLLESPGSLRREMAFAGAVLSGGHPQRETGGDGSRLTDRAAALTITMPELEPVRRVCRSHCPGEVGACTRTAYTLLGGYWGLTDLQSPLEKIIPSELYFSSDRFAIDMFRHMDPVLLRFWLDARPEIVDLCLARQAVLANPRRTRSLEPRHWRELGIER